MNSRTILQRLARPLAGLVALVSAVALAGQLRVEATPPGDARPDPPVPRPAPPRFAESLDVDVFQRGNIHAHSAVSDGDSPVKMVLRWYREHDYQFVALTDHNRRLEPSKFPDAARSDFVVLPGEELTMAAAGVPVHVNGVCTKNTIGGAHFAGRRAALAWAVERIEAQGGVAMINHPNFHYALGVEHMAPVRGAHLLDVYNGHPHVHSDGDDKHPSVETLWQRLLDRGMAIAPAAVDDMHRLTDRRSRRVPKSLPGTGWVGVFSSTTAAGPICDAMRAGRLYASNGPRLARLVVKGPRMRVWVEDAAWKVEFLARGGRMLPSTRRADGSRTRHTVTLQGDEGYVRARVTRADGKRAWTNAYRLAPPRRVARP